MSCIVLNLFFCSNDNFKFIGKKREKKLIFEIKWQNQTKRITSNVTLVYDSMM